jgi:hypothetical protein
MLVLKLKEGHFSCSLRARGPSTGLFAVARKVGRMIAAAAVSG